MQNPEGIDLRWILTVIRRYAILIAACTLLAAAAALLAVWITPPTYVATSTLIVKPSQSSNTSTYSDLMAAELLAQTYSQMMKGRPVLAAAAEQLNNGRSPESLAKKVTAGLIPDTQLILLTVKDSSPEEAARIANAITGVFTEQVRALNAERYTSSLKNLQNKMDAISTETDQIQLQIDQTNSKIIAAEASLTQRNSQQAENRNDLRTLKQNYQSMQFSVAQLSEQVHIVETAHLATQQLVSPYTATLTLLINPSLSANSSSSVLSSEQLVSTYGQMLESRSVLDETISKLGLVERVSNLADRIEIDPVPGTSMIRLTVTDDDSRQAVLLADTIASTFVDQLRESFARPYANRLAELQEEINRLSDSISAMQAEIQSITEEKALGETELARLNNQMAGKLTDYQQFQQEYEQMQVSAVNAAETVAVAEPAHVPEEPDSSNMLKLVLATVVGLMVGSGLAFVLEYLDDTIKTSDDVAKLLGIGVLGKIYKFPNYHNENGYPKLIVITDPRSPVAEAFRVLANNIRFATLDKPAKSLIITSASPGEGKSAVTANLAVTLSRAEKNVIVVDADLRMPQQHKLFSLDPGEGLSGALLNGNVNGNLRDVETEGLRVLTSGSLPSNPADVIGSARMQRLLADLTNQAKVVLIDCPPVLPVADASLLSSKADGVLLVVRANQTRRRAAADALQSLQQAGANVIGVVINAVADREEGYYSYYYQPKAKKGFRFDKLLPRRRPPDAQEAAEPASEAK